MMPGSYPGHYQGHPDGVLVTDLALNLHTLWDMWDKPAMRKAALDAAVKIGASRVRIDVGWINAQPNAPVAGSSGWDEKWMLGFEQRLSEAVSRGLKVQVMFYSPPAWAAVGQAGGKGGEPKYYAQFANACEYMAKRFPQVDVWETWNEPDLPDYWPRDAAGAIRPGEFVSLARLAYQGYKRGNPKCTVILGAPTYLGMKMGWLESCYKNGAGHGVTHDAIGIHPYLSPANVSPDSKSDQWSIRGIPQYVIVLLDKYNDPSPIYATEFGWSTHKSYSANAWEQGVTEAQQAAFTVTAMNEFGKIPRVVSAAIYQDIDHNRMSVHEQNFGILRRDLSEKPVVAALAALAKQPAPPPPAPDPTVLLVQQNQALQDTLAKTQDRNKAAAAQLRSIADGLDQ